MEEKNKEKINEEVKETVYTFVKCWLSRVITEQTIAENLRYFINLVVKEP